MEAAPVGIDPARPPTASRDSPWINTGPDMTATARASFLQVLQSGIPNAALNTKDQQRNIYMMFGYASAGYSNFDVVLACLEAWCQDNDERHGSEGWILMTQGDGDYGHESIETLASHVAARGVPVVFIQSDFGYCEPGTPYWPSYATAGFFGPGVRHKKVKMRDGEPVMKDGQPVMQECWGGFQKDEAGERTGDLAYVDWAMMFETFGDARLMDHVGGVFVAGGGEITVEQAEIYDVLGCDLVTGEKLRPGDFVAVSRDSKGNVSGTGVATLDNFEQIRANSLFQQLDVSGDGVVNASEFELLACPEGDASKLFEEMDFNLNGTISLDEFRHYVALQKQHYGPVAAGLVLRDLAHNIATKKSLSSDSRLQESIGRLPTMDRSISSPLGSRATISASFSPGDFSSLPDTVTEEFRHETELKLTRSRSRSTTKTLQSFQQLLRAPTRSYVEPGQSTSNRVATAI